MILEITAEAAAALSANGYFSNIPIVAVNDKDIQSRVDQFLAKVGIGVVLGTSRLGKPVADIQGGGSLYFEEIIFHATIFENVPVNRASSGTGKFASTVAETVAVVLHWHKPVNISECLICVQGPTMVPYENKELLVYDVAFRTNGGIKVNPIISTIATPTIVIVDNGDGTSTITLACSTLYSQIWYTTDGSFPAPLDGTNMPRAPYTVPFVVNNITNAAGGTKVQVRAWLPGYIPSTVLKQNV